MTRRVAADLTQAEDFIRRQQPFRLKGSGRPTLWATCDPPSLLGHLPPHHSEGIETAEYVVMSYTTPIAWLTDGEPTVPDVGYSPTTGQHQYLAAHALGVDFRPARNRDTVQIPRNDALYGRARRLRRGGMDGAVPVSDEEWLSQPSALSPGRSPEPVSGFDYTDAMSTDFRAQDELINEVAGYVRPHP